jgi:chromatin remodeling complex protein RSC6
MDVDVPSAPAEAEAEEDLFAGEWGDPLFAADCNLVREHFPSAEAFLGDADLHKLTFHALCARLSLTFSQPLVDRHKDALSRWLTVYVRAKSAHDARQTGAARKKALGEYQWPLLLDEPKINIFNNKNKGIAKRAANAKEPAPAASSSSRGKAEPVGPSGCTAALAAFMDLEAGAVATRAEATKFILKYSRAQTLVDDEKRTITLDPALKKLFGPSRKTLSIPHLSRMLAKHFKGTTEGKVASKARKRKKPASEGGGTAKRTRLPQPMRLSDPLFALMGRQRRYMSRPQVIKGLWKYIKAHTLQDPQDGRQILCDDTLREVMQVDRISMMEMNKTLTVHLQKVKLDEMLDEDREVFTEAVHADRRQKEKEDREAEAAKAAGPPSSASASSSSSAPAAEAKEVASSTSEMPPPP